MSFPVLTPICKNYKTKKQQEQGIPDSRRDYNEQQQRALDNKELMWDDAKGNPTNKAGGFFCFVHNNKNVEIHIVTQICKTNERLDSWARNVGHHDRNVLMLSPKIMEINWQVWSKELEITPKMERGTRVVKSKAQDLTSFVREHFKYTFDEETKEIFIH